MDKKDRLKACAYKLHDLFNARNITEPVMKEALDRITPLLDNAITGSELPKKLPRFFFGMHDHEFSAHYLSDTELLNALSEFDDALQA